MPAGRLALQAYVADVAATFHPKPVWYRMSDLWSDEANLLQGNELERWEHNPVIGTRGLRRLLQTPESFDAEVGAIREVAADKPNVHLLLPFVQDADEFARGLAALSRIGWPNRIGAMLEVPSAILDVDGFIAEGASHLLVGVNDLSSLLLGAERSHGFDDKEHPTLWWCVEAVAQAAGSIEWGLAGNVYPRLLKLAAAHGVPYVSVHYSELPSVCGCSPRDLVDLDLVSRIREGHDSALRDYHVRRLRNRYGE